MITTKKKGFYAQVLDSCLCKEDYLSFVKHCLTLRCVNFLFVFLQLQMWSCHYDFMAVHDRALEVNPMLPFATAP